MPVNWKPKGSGWWASDSFAGIIKAEIVLCEGRFVVQLRHTGDREVLEDHGGDDADGAPLDLDGAKGKALLLMTEAVQAARDEASNTVLAADRWLHEHGVPSR